MLAAFCPDFTMVSRWARVKAREAAMAQGSLNFHCAPSAGNNRQAAPRFFGRSICRRGGRAEVEATWDADSVVLSSLGVWWVPRCPSARHRGHPSFVVEFALLSPAPGPPARSQRLHRFSVARMHRVGSGALRPRLKPNIDLAGFIGMTEVMPCYKALRNPSLIEFSAACEARTLQGCDLFRGSVA